jgi:hypothetical protein
MKNLILTFIFTLTTSLVVAQNILGIVTNKVTKTPIQYVNIGIVGKSVGTVSDEKGVFNLKIDPIYKNETLLFSCIGYQAVSVKISDLINGSQKIEMQEAQHELKEVVVIPKIYTEKILGIKTTGKSVVAGFSENKLGYEMGVMMKAKKSAYLKTVNINIASCNYDTIFYRLNVYKVIGDNEFENILTEPIYIKIAKEQIKETISIDLKSKNIVTEGNFLVSLEHVKDLGQGYLMFCSALMKKTYTRKTSQGAWETTSIAGVSISVVADVEK